MKILMVHPHDVYAPEEPWTIRITHLAAELQKIGHEVKVVYHLLDPHADPSSAATRQEFAFETIPLIRHSRTLLRKNRQMKALARWADLLHFQKCFSWASLPCLSAGQSLCTPVHYDWDDWEYEIWKYRPDDPHAGALISRVEDSLPRMADSVSVASQALRQRALRLGARPDRLVLAPVGADMERFDPERVSGEGARTRHQIEGLVVCYMGQLHGAQFAEHFLRAGKLLVDQDREVTFLVVGGGYCLDELKRQARELGIAHRCVFTGFVAHEQVPEYLAAADVTVACFADNEQTRCKSPLKLVEYMAMARAIVATEMGEVPAMVGDAARLVGAGQVADMARAIADFLDHEDKRREYGGRARRRALGHYSWAATAKTLESVYEQDVEEYDRLYPRRKKKARALVDAQGRLGGGSLTAPGPVFRAKRFLRENRDLMGVLDGTRSYVGPRIVQIDPTNLCNNDCVACWCNSPLLDEWKIPPVEKRATIVWNVLDTLIDDLAELGTKEIYLAGGGDPMVHARILPFLEKIKSAQMIVYVNTNFLPATEDSIRQMVRLGVDDFTISAWAGSPEAYDATHPNKGPEHYHELIAKLRFLQELGLKEGKPRVLPGGHRPRGPRVKMYHVMSRLNADDFPNMIDAALDLDVDWVEFTVVDTMPGLTDDLVIPEAQRLRLVENCRHAEDKLAALGKTSILYNWNTWMRRIQSAGQALATYDEEFIHSFPCTVGYTFARVTATGEVHSCLKSHRIPLGSLYEHSFLELWTSPKQATFRQKTKVLRKDDPFFSLIGNDPAQACGCVKSCDDIGRNLYLWNRWRDMPLHKKAFLKAGKWYFDAKGRHLVAENGGSRRSQTRG